MLYCKSCVKIMSDRLEGTYYDANEYINDIPEMLYHSLPIQTSAASTTYQINAVLQRCQQKLAPHNMSISRRPCGGTKCPRECNDIVSVRTRYLCTRRSNNIAHAISFKQYHRINQCLSSIHSFFRSSIHPPDRSNPTEHSTNGSEQFAANLSDEMNNCCVMDLGDDGEYSDGEVDCLGPSGDSRSRKDAHGLLM